MKTAIYTSKGEKKGELELPKIFSSKIRQDLVFKYVEAEKFVLAHPYTSDPEGGKKSSASGTISHKRHDWKGHYGRGVSRIPRKTMWRRGEHFYWIGAEVSGTRGGRRAHPPELVKRLRKINKKESKMAIQSAIAATADKKLISERYSSIDKIDSAPFVIESFPEKTKDFVDCLKKVLGPAFSIALKKKEIRAGKGKSRGRKYKSNAGILILTGNEEKVSFKGVEIKSINELHISDLYPLGRLTLYTKKAIEELGGKK